MTRPMHQDAAAAVLRRTMVLLLMLLTFSLSSFPSVTAECPDKCTCREAHVYCIFEELDRIPDRIPPDIKVMDLSYNKIGDIKPKLFTQLTELKTLTLYGNKISNLKNGAFASLSKLQTLFLSANGIDNIDTGCFNNLTSLENLNLDHNKIHNLDFVQSKGLARLNILYLSFNKIQDIEPKSFTHLTELKYLMLDNNEISYLKNGAFAKLSKLKTLFLSGNIIENIETGVFSNLTSLESLSLDKNKIHKLDLEMFKGLIKLDTLSLSHNMIRNIPPGIFDSLTSLSLLKLDHNPLACDCNIMLFVNALKKNYPQLDVFGDIDPLCHFPVEMIEKSLKKLTEKDFHCTSPDVIVVPENKTVSVGEELQLSCKAVGDPEPLITWARDDIYLELGQRVQVFQNNTLIISKVERTDGGQYKCVASNYLGRKSFEAMVNVNVDICILPTVEGVVYTYEGSNESLTHGTFIDLHITVNENCKFGYHKVHPNSFRVCQRDGKWKTVSDKLCLKMCPPLESDSLYIKCTHNGKYANCSNPSIPDTIAKPVCKPSHTVPNGHENEPLELLCLPNGTWNTVLYRCIPSCGKVNDINYGVIMSGEKAPIGTAPWNVGVYRFNTKNSNNYDLICGGSIISPKLVVSAAHCFWGKGMVSNIISINDGQYKIAVGKYSRNITIIDNEFTKIMNVTTVYLEEYYHGPSGFHAEDIAIVVLQNRISFSIGVSPVCVDWMGIHTIPNGAKGKIVGWGKTEKGIDSPILLEASLPYIDHNTCWKMYTNGFQSFVHKDKFCAGSAWGQGVLEGDSGAGLCFSHSDLYYLTGVTSVKDASTNNSIALFTEVKHHIEWISRLFNNKTLSQ